MQPSVRGRAPCTAWGSANPAHLGIWPLSYHRGAKKPWSSTSAHPNYCKHAEQNKQKADFVPQKADYLAKRLPQGKGTRGDITRGAGGLLRHPCHGIPASRGHFPPWKAARPLLKFSPVLPSPRDGHQTSLLCSGPLWTPNLLHFDPGSNWATQTWFFFIPWVSPS